LPTYEYHCDSCDENFDVVQSFQDDPLTTCPTCGSPVRKVFGNVGIVFKGSGFYKTDSRTKSTAKAGSGEGSSSSDSGSGGSEGSGGPDGAGSGSDSKPSSGSGDGSTTATPTKEKSTPKTPATASKGGESKSATSKS
jgi:putative FmdB family regulatory protein